MTTRATKSQASSLARFIVAGIAEDKERLAPEMRHYAFEVFQQAARFVRDRKCGPDAAPEAIELAFELFDEDDLVHELCAWPSPNALDSAAAKRVLAALQRFALA